MSPDIDQKVLDELLMLTWKDGEKAKWNDVILNESFKKALQKDVYSFFDSEALYKELGIPWKRGLIMFGPPGKLRAMLILLTFCS